MIKVNKDIIRESINHYGPDIQATVCMEEAAELIQAISKIKRYGRDEKTAGHLEEEVADVLICISMIKEIYDLNEDQITWWIEKKQARTKERMEAE